MKWFSLRRVLALGVLLLVLSLGLGCWLLGSRTASRYVENWVREQFTKGSPLVLGRLQVELTPWRDFPHLTASVRHFTLTDTAAGQPLQVLSIGRADLRLAWRDVLHRRFRVTRLSVTDVLIQERVDSLGRRWGLQPKRRKPTASPPPAGFDVDSVRLFNCRIVTRNDYIHSALSAVVRRGSLTARQRNGVMRLVGTLNGQLDYLRNPTSTLFTNEPVRASINYQYAFAKRQGTFLDTHFSLNGDTVQLNGTHTVAADRPTGTQLNLQFSGDQPLLDVFNTVVPPRLRPYLAGASSPSKASIHYTITGISGPSERPRTVLQFKLDGARVTWPDSSRRINRWDLAGTYDNGPAHNPTTTSLVLKQCRITTSAGQLDIGLLLRNFKRPWLEAHVQGRTELPELAAVVAPGTWRARRGQAALNLNVRGLLRPALSGRVLHTVADQGLQVQGTVVLRGAAFTLLRRGAEVRNLNVNIALNDSSWRLNNASGTVAGMRFRASARTLYLLAYLTDQHPTTSISGNFAVDELHLGRLRQLLRPLPPLPGQARRRRRLTAAQLTATLGNSIIPPTMRLNVGLRCTRLVLADDTLRDIAVHVHHDGRKVQLSRLSGRVWGGTVRGQAAWPTALSNKVAPVNFNLNVRFGTINYQRFVAHLMRPAPIRPAKLLKNGRPQPPNPALRELLLASNGQVRCTIDTVRLPDGDELRNLRLQLIKDNDRLRLPYLRFATRQGGTGDVAAAARLTAMHLSDADMNVNLYYPVLDIRELLRLLVRLTPPRRAPTAAKLAARSQRRAKRASAAHGSLLSNGKLVAVVRVQADKVRYTALTGTRFKLVSRLDDGEARLEDCSFDAFSGHVKLRGRLATPDENPNQHTLRVQLLLDEVSLPELSTTANAMKLRVLAPENVRGTLRCTADLNTLFDGSFAPALDRTQGYLKADFRDLELLNVEALEQGLGFLRKERTSHLVFEPVSSEFVLDKGELLIPHLRLNSNLSQLAVSGAYGLDGRANLYLGLKPLQTLFGNNDKRVGRILRDQPVNRNPGKLTYLNLRRTSPGTKYSVRIFKKNEQRAQQAELRRRCEEVVRTQQLDTTLQLFR